MNDILISIKPYWVFLIIAKTMSWDIPKYKTIEVRKTRPDAKNWSKKVLIYCTKDVKSFKQIPIEYQAQMKQFLGKIVGEFICDEIYEIIPHDDGYGANNYLFDGYYGEDGSCLTFKQLNSYLKNKIGYGWHISNLKIYDKPKELSEFKTPCYSCGYQTLGISSNCKKCSQCAPLTRPPQSYCKVMSSTE